MARIILIGNKEYEIQNERAKNLKEDWISGKLPEVIDLEFIAFNKRNLKEIILDEQERKEKEYTNDQCREFMKLLEEIKNRPLKHELSYYGEPIYEITDFFSKQIKKIDPPKVHNDILKMIEPQIIEYLLEQKAITRHSDFWAVGPNAAEFREWYKKNEALERYHWITNYAKEKQTEQLDEIKQELQEAFEM